MSLEALSAKRIRRQWEPEEKAWHDDALDVPWEDLQPPLHKTTVFALKNIFFFSHATPVQARAIGVLMQNRHSAIVEAPTGSGKTLGFLIPIMERSIRACEAYVALHRKPPLTRSILGVILSPSRTLAEQTFVVAKNLAARFPFNIQFALCDGVVERAEHVVNRLRHNTRGAGTFLVTTPKDLEDVLALLRETGGESGDGARGASREAVGREEEDKEALLAVQDARTRERYLAKKKRQRLEAEAAAAAAVQQTDSPPSGKPQEGRAGGRAPLEKPSPTSSSSTPLPRSERDADTVVRLQALHGSRFIVVVDEADLVFNSPEMRNSVGTFIKTYCGGGHADTEGEGRERGRGKGAKTEKVRGMKRLRQPASSSSSFSSPHSGAGERWRDTLPTDYAFVGATVATSNFVQQYAKELCADGGTELHLIAANSSTDFVSQLQNRYLVCDAYNFLPFLIQTMNLHASKKHFVFFNNYRALLFARELFSVLSRGVRPMLFIKDVYTMYEGMTENTRIDQYNKFLTHAATTATVANAARDKARREKQSLSDAQKRNHIFMGGWKRDGKAPMGSGAILLCTDIAAFGLDVRDVDYVYHFEPPSTVQSYVHRIGRVGRMGMKGSSILLLPCITESQRGMEQSRERKTTSTRFHTVTNTKNSTMELQTARISVDHLSEEHRQYVADLGTHSALEEFSLPPFAPIASTLRSIITQDKKLLKLAKAAAMSMCQPITSSDECTSWFTPKLALQSLLLD